MKPHATQQQRVKEEFKKEIEKYLDASENGNILEFVRCSKSSSEREAHRNKKSLK